MSLKTVNKSPQSRLVTLFLGSFKNYASSPPSLSVLFTVIKNHSKIKIFAPVFFLRLNIYSFKHHMLLTVPQSLAYVGPRCMVDKEVDTSRRC